MSRAQTGCRYGCEGPAQRQDSGLDMSRGGGSSGALAPEEYGGAAGHEAQRQEHPAGHGESGGQGDLTGVERFRRTSSHR